MSVSIPGAVVRKRASWLVRLIDFSASRAGRQTFTFIFLLAAVYAVAGGLILRLWVPRTLKHDNAFFLPLVFALNNGLGLVNPWASPNGSAIFNWHGFGHPLLLGWLSPTRGWAGVNAAVVLASTFGMLVYLVLIWRTAAPPFIKAICALLIPPVFIGFGGRPETSAALLIAALIAVNWVSDVGPRRRLYQLFGSSIILGLLGATHPVGAIASAVTYSAWLVGRTARNQRSPIESLGLIALVACVAGVTLALVLAGLYPHDAGDWLVGVSYAGQGAAERFGEGEFLRYFAATKHTPFLFLAFVPLIFVMVAWWHRCRSTELFSRLVVTLCGVGLLALLIRFSIGVPASYYNFTLLLPALVVLVCSVFDQLTNRNLPRTLVIGSLVMFSGFSSAAQVLWAYQVLSASSVLTIQKEEVLSRVETYVGNGWRVAVDAPLLVAIDDVNTALGVDLLYFGRVEDGGKYHPSPDSFDVVFRAQAEFARPPLIEGFSLVEDAYLAGFGATSFSRPEHLGYAVYHSDRLEAKQGVPPPTLLPRGD